MIQIVIDVFRYVKESINTLQQKKIQNLLLSYLYKP